jgi:hypothetical protein
MHSSNHFCLDILVSRPFIVILAPLHIPAVWLMLHRSITAKPNFSFS